MLPHVTVLSNISAVVRIPDSVKCRRNFGMHVIEKGKNDLQRKSHSSGIW